jgi:hypothetical protein
VHPLSYLPCLITHAHLPVGVKPRRRLSPCPKPRSMNVANLLSTRFLLSNQIFHPALSRSTSTFISRPVPQQHWVDCPHSAPLATYTQKCRLASTMASESLNTAEREAREHSNRSSSSEDRTGTPYAARAAAGAAAANSFFPLGYREGFSQWVSCLQM